MDLILSKLSAVPYTLYQKKTNAIIEAIRSNKQKESVKKTLCDTGAAILSLLNNVSLSSFFPHPFSLLDKMNEQDVRKKKKKKTTSNLDIEENKQEKGIVVSVLLSRIHVIVPNIIVCIPKFSHSQILELFKLILL